MRLRGDRAHRVFDRIFLKRRFIPLAGKFQGSWAGEDGAKKRREGFFFEGSGEDRMGNFFNGGRLGLREEGRRGCRRLGGGF